MIVTAEGMIRIEGNRQEKRIGRYQRGCSSQQPWRLNLALKSARDG